MTIDDFLSKLDAVTPRGSRWGARCPAHHPDRSPSLSVSEGERGILIKCWSGCEISEICASLGIKPADLFYDALASDPQRRREAIQQRDRQRHEREKRANQQGALIDALREADYFVRSRRGIDISQWSIQRLDDELNSLATAYTILESEGLHE